MKINLKFKNNFLKITKTTISDIIFANFVLVDLLRFFTIIPLTLGNLLYLILGVISIVYTIIIKGFKQMNVEYLFLLIYSFFGVLGFIYNRNMDFIEILWPFAFLGLAILFLNFNISKKLTKYTYYFVSFLFIIKIILSKNVNDLNIVASRNSINLVLLIYFSLYVISRNNKNKEGYLFPILLGFIVSVLSIGRSGVLTFGLLLFMYIIYSNNNISSLRKLFFIIIKLVLVSIFLFITYEIFEIYILKAVNNFLQRGFDSIRTIIWYEYIMISISNIKNFLFGSPIRGTSLLNQFSHNLHNSFLMLHAKYGIFILFLILLMILNTYRFLFRKRNYMLIILFIVILFRMQFDYTNFNAQLDIVFYYYLFIPFKKNCVNSLY